MTSGHAMDTLTVTERSKRMARVKGKDTTPEMRVRRLVHGMGYRYRLHRSDLPGTPDLVFPSRRKVIFIHGCFWHRHPNCRLARLPKSKREFWESKLEQNRKRDLLNQDKIHQMGWYFLITWECMLDDMNKVDIKIREFLG